MIRSYAALIPAAFIFATPAFGALFSPDAKVVCDDLAASSSAKVDARKLISKLFDEEQLSDWLLDSTGATVIDHTLRVKALTTSDFCKASPCGKNGQQKIDGARSDLETFLEHARLGRNAVYSPDRDPGPPAKYPDEVGDYLVGNKYALVCHEADQPVIPPIAKSPIERIAIRGSINDLSVSPIPYKALSSATFGAEKDSIADKNKYSITGAAGYMLDRVEFASTGHMDIVPFLDSTLKKTVPTPSTGNTNVLSGGVFLDLLFRAGIYHELKIAPQVVRDFEDKSNTALIAATYVPMPNIHGISAPQRLGTDIEMFLQPSISLMYGDVLTQVPSTGLATSGNFHRIGPGVDVRIYGTAPGSFLEQITLSVSAVYLYTSGEAGFDRLRNSQTAISYALGKSTDRPSASITLKYSTGRDLVTLQQLRDLNLSIGFKY
jgi:hypothetical protein